MFIFLDESGDLGFDFNQTKTSKFFVITLLVCETPILVHQIRAAVKKTLQRKLNHKAKRKKNELKGNQTHLSIKEYFYNLIAPYSGFKLATIIVNKKALAQEINAIDKHRLYIQLSYQGLKSIGLEDAKPTFVHLIADRCKQGAEAKDYHHCVQTHLKTLLPLSSKMTIEQLDSTQDFGLQAVDLFSYGIFCKYEMNNCDWYQSFQNRIIEERLFK